MKKDQCTVLNMNFDLVIDKYNMLMSVPELFTRITRSYPSIINVIDIESDGIKLRHSNQLLVTILVIKIYFFLNDSSNDDKINL